MRSILMCCALLAATFPVAAKSERLPDKEMGEGRTGIYRISDNEAEIKAQIAAIAPSLMTNDLQMQCFNDLFSKMNDPNSLKIQSNLSFNMRTSTSNLTILGNVFFTTRIWGRSKWGQMAGADLSCIYNVDNSGMRFLGMGLVPSNVGILINGY